MSLFSRICPSHICGYDVDEVFAYSTMKRVTIRDARLGFLFYIMTGLIVLYIFVYQLIWQGGYLSFSEPTNSARITVQQPTALEGGQPCNPNDLECQDNFTSPASLPYCWAPNRTIQNSSGIGISFKTLNCSYMDGSEVASLHGKSILMTTAVHAYSQSLNLKDCETSFGAVPSPHCKKLWKIDSDTAWYVVDPESFTLLLDHSPATPKVQVDRAAAVGFLFVDDGGARQDDFCRRYDGVKNIWSGGKATDAPCYVRPSRVGLADYFHIGFLLDSLGLSLDEPHEESAEQPELAMEGKGRANQAKARGGGGGGSVESKRYSGLIIRATIEYQNFWPLHLGAQHDVHYVYKLKTMRASSYKETRIVNTQYPTQRIKQDLHGVLFEVQAGGYLASFDFTTLLLQLTTSLALLALASTVVNLLAQYVLKYSPYYRRAMYTTSPDFSDLWAANQMSDDELHHQLERMALRTGGDRVSKVMRLLAAGWTAEGGAQNAEGGTFPRDGNSFASSATPSASASAACIANDRAQVHAASASTGEPLLPASA